MPIPRHQIADVIKQSQKYNNSILVNQRWMLMKQPGRGQLRTTLSWIRVSTKTTLTRKWPAILNDLQRSPAVFNKVPRLCFDIVSWFFHFPVSSDSTFRQRIGLLLQQSVIRRLPCLRTSLGLSNFPASASADVTGIREEFFESCRRIQFCGHGLTRPTNYVAGVQICYSHVRDSPILSPLYKG